MILAIDIGNSRVKAGLFEDGRLFRVWKMDHATFLSSFSSSLQPWILGKDLQYAGWVNVGEQSLSRGISFLNEIVTERLLEINAQTAMPIMNGYQSATTLGADRLVSAVGAYSFSGKGPILSMDAGTALTYDFVDAGGTYLGGGIAPGLRMRFRALNEHTARLPLLAPQPHPPLVGRNTSESLQSGVVNGMAAEMDGIIARYRELAGPDLVVALTGGDSPFLQVHLKNLTFANADMLLYGIQAILLHQQAHA